MNDTTYPSVYLSYLVFFLLSCGAVFFFIRSLKDGYMGKDSEAPKYRMLEAEPGEDQPTITGGHAPRR